ncbi:DUF7734 family protein [Leptothoe spongobia]|uniref:DUF7734 domain-containing protein n=1 Tax=Leptothoe spongobia TAU-MAC 1115 TaxID=1967444 RepID=A0A947GKM4_9CYAN|nr:hypothetical protein [Leptothoe spongobia]MBT9316572.1 hypothetical protein [Leptothoe spongobia TAU-MAC 1115]
MAISIEKQLEQYTLHHPQEVLLVTAEIDDELDKILIFRGFSSSLVRSTASDPDIPVLPDNAVNIMIDRLAGPYQPSCPNYLEQQISWDQFAKRLTNP